MELNASRHSSFATFPKPRAGRRRLDVLRLAVKPRLLRCAAERSEMSCKGAGSGDRSKTLEFEGNGFERLLSGSFISRRVIAAAASLLISSCGCDGPAVAEPLTVAFPVSKTHEVNTVQRTLVEAWGLVRESFIDPTFNHQDWDSKLQQTMVEIFPMKSADAAYNKIGGILSTLGDPFTRIISPKEYQSFRIGSDGNLQGVGLFINVDPNSGHLIVLSCIEGSPAYRAGIHEGDELLEIDGNTSPSVSLELATIPPFVPGDSLIPSSSKLPHYPAWDTFFRQALAPVNKECSNVFYTKLGQDISEGRLEKISVVKIPREAIKLLPLSTAVFSHRLQDGHELKTGYVRLLTFSQTAANEMENVIQQMEGLGVQSYILDLRNNPGGLVKAGLDIAQIWLDGDETLVNTIDREGNMFPISMVNEGSASASEILAGALHDNGRAVLVGNRTFGKGKIQSVTELHDGSALFITVAKYLSPALHDIDKVGITPDVRCTPGMLTTPSVKSPLSPASPLEADSCIMVAEHELEVQSSKG
ncbi:C-terminal processing peptidase, chloroplastic [Apostasia shenzhenica]|uniref:C-terminal processing peptidase n=1 Tax=Apostasia shenzhenica TaxID=1088818 RepID=A0A2I0AXS7_9ASPA|nr:C-terminal processing peptidase, chloroplastic [Apostasia shenzhenica]